MIEVDINKCCGCTACENICPKNCISFKYDSEGFAYPSIETESCINCGMCESVCPFLAEHNKRIPDVVYAAKNKNDRIRLESSSGGIFTALALQIFKRGGFVVGAAFDSNFNVKHVIINNKNELSKLQGSKYVQSDLRGLFKPIKKILEDGQLLLFSGTPCQINGLKNFLRKDFDNLICVEIVCHGVPSPLIWKDYLNSRIESISPVCISFRDKRKGWAEYGLAIKKEDGSELYENREDCNYLKGYLANVFLRPSCYNCPSKSGISRADICLGDYWGINRAHKDFSDNKGVSLVMVYSQKGKDLFESSGVEYILSQLSFALEMNPMIAISTSRPVDREFFWDEYHRVGIGALQSVIRRRRPNYYIRVMNCLKNNFRKILKRK